MKPWNLRKNHKQIANNYKRKLLLSSSLFFSDKKVVDNKLLVSWLHFIRQSSQSDFWNKLYLFQWRKWEVFVDPDFFFVRYERWRRIMFHNHNHIMYTLRLNSLLSARFVWHFKCLFNLRICTEHSLAKKLQK